MMQLTFITGNDHKLLLAQTVCAPAGITITRAKLDITEIQAEDGATIARDKAAKAFAQINKPIVVTDDSWSIPGLKGFPGPYMHYVNEWFTIDDWLRLTTPLADRRIIIRQILVYQDEHQQKTFSVELTGRLLTDSKGLKDAVHPHFAITTFDDHDRSVAQLVAEGKSAIAHLPTAWHDLCKWLTAESSRNKL